MLKTVSEQTNEPPAQQQPTSSLNSDQTNKPAVKKSRFSSHVSNVTQEQVRFRQEQQFKQSSKPEQICSEDMDVEDKSLGVGGGVEEQEEQCDIVFHIDKWPDALKNYCARVYKQYANSTQVSEDQVTKYLQKRITDAFKVRPDLNVGWETESIPEIYDIKQVRN